MQVTNAAFPRLDLQQQRMLDLSWSCLITDESSVMSLLKNLDLLKIGEFASYSSYGGGKTKYEIVSAVSLAPGGGLIFKANYYVLETRLGLTPQPSNQRLTAKLLHQLGLLTPEYALTCIATFYFEEDEAAPYFPWFEPAPALQTPGTPRPLSIVETLSGSKYTDDDTTDVSAYDYGVSFAREPGSGVSLEIDFSLSSKLTVKLAATAFDRAVAIAASLRP